MHFPSRVLRVVAVCFLFVGTATAAVREEAVTYESDVRLAAVLLLPEAGQPLPAAVIVHGSGGSDRSNAWARSAAELLLARGVAVLLTDKRGSGLSGGDWRSAGFEELATDALAGVAYLRSRSEIDPARVGLLGLSQGGWIVPIAAARRPEIAFVIDLSGTSVSFAEQSYLEMSNTARQAGLSEAAVGEIVALNRAAGRFLMGGAWSDYADARAAALAGPAQPVAAGFPESRDAPVWAFLSKVVAFDPLPYWSVVDQPVFVGLGERDELDNVPVAESVRRFERIFGLVGKRNFDIVVAPGVGHALWIAEGVFEPTLASRLERWLDTHVLVARGH